MQNTDINILDAIRWGLYFMSHSVNKIETARIADLLHQIALQIQKKDGLTR